MLAESALPALAVTLAAAAVARLLRTVDTGGAVAGVAVGGLVSAALGLPGLAVLATFFVLGSLVTRVGWSRKSAAGTAERGGGARDAARVLGKGSIGAVGALLPGAVGAIALAGAMAAAAADTFGTEIGLLARGEPRRLPTFRRVPAGTPGAVSISGTAAATSGAVVIAGVAAAALELTVHAGTAVLVGGFAAAMLESLAAGALPPLARAPGWVRNVLTTSAGAALALAIAAAQGSGA